jgi:aminopeptidase N
MRRALELDSLKNSHPVEVPVSRAEDVDEIFDSISYSKGASIIRMLVCFLGEEEFRKGLVMYLNRHKYANASTEDLWKALGDHSKKDVKDFMDRWTKTMGYPVLALSDTINAGNKISVTQSWFLADGSKSSEGEEGAWQIPLKVVSDHGISLMQLLKSREDSVQLPHEKSSWFKLNASQEGLYR